MKNLLLLFLLSTKGVVVAHDLGDAQYIKNRQLGKYLEVKKIKSHEKPYYSSSKDQKWIYDENWHMVLEENQHYCLDIDRHHGTDVVLMECDYKKDTQEWTPQIIPETYDWREQTAYFRLYNAACNLYLDDDDDGKDEGAVELDHDNYGCSCQEFGRLPVTFFKEFYSWEHHYGHH